MYCLMRWIAWLAAQCYGSSQWLFFPPILFLLLPLISDGSKFKCFGSSVWFWCVTVHKNIYKVVIRVLGVAAFVLGKPPPSSLRAAAHFVGRLAALQGLLWGGLHSLCPSGTSIIFGFPFQNAFHKSHFLVSHYSMLCEFRLRHAVNQIRIWCKSASSCCSWWSCCKILYPWSILPVNFLLRVAVLVQWKRVHVFRGEMLAGTPNCKSHLHHKVLNFTDFDISVLFNEMIFLSGNPHVVHFWVLEIGAE